MIQFPRPPSARRSLPAAAADRHYRLRRHRAGHSDDRPAVAAQLAAQWQLGPAQIGHLFSTELGAMSPPRCRRGGGSGASTGGGSLRCRRWCLSSATASALVQDFTLLLPLRFIASLAGGTLMILCITCAAGTANPSRVYAFWVLGQLVLGAVGLLVLPPLFAHFGLMAVYLILAAIMLCCLPLIPAFPNGFTAARTARSGPAASPARKLCAVLAVLTFTSA